MTIVREKFLTAPQVTTAPGGVLTQATVVEAESIGWRSEDGLYPSWNCLDTIVPTTICPPEVEVQKEFSEAEWVAGFNFSVQGGITCKLVGYEREEAYSALREAFIANESKGVERALIGTRFVATSSGVTPGWNAAIDLTPTAGAVSPKVGLAILEGYAGQVYTGVPTIHAPRTVASLLADGSLQKEEDGKFFTKLGSKFVNGAGYEPSTGPLGGDPSPGEYWLYASGEVLVERGPVVTRDGLDYRTNEDFALVERSYRVAVECFTAAVLVEVF